MADINPELKEKIDEMSKNATKFEEDDYLTFEEKVVKFQINDIRNLMSEGKWDEARRLMELNLPIIDDFETRFADTEKGEFRVFNEAFDEILYNTIFKKEKEVYYMPMLSVDAYISYAIILSHFKEYDKALDYYKKVLFRNPVESHAIFQMIEIYKIKNDMNSLFELSKKAVGYVYRPADVARAHRCLAYYFSAKEKYDLALAYLAMSRTFDPECKSAIQEMQAIVAKSKNKVKMPEVKEAFDAAKREGVPFGPDGNVISLANTLAKSSMSIQRPFQARYFYEIVYGLTRNEEIKAEMDKIKIN